MKKVLPLLLLALLLTACAAQVSQLQQLPDEGVHLVSVLVTAGLLWVLLKISAVLKFDLSGYAGAVAAVLAPILVALLEKYLQLIPATYDSLVLTVIHFVVLLVGSLGTFWILQRRPQPSLR